MNISKSSPRKNGSTMQSEKRWWPFIQPGRKLRRVLIILFWGPIRYFVFQPTDRVFLTQIYNLDHDAGFAHSSHAPRLWAHPSVYMKDDRIHAVRKFPFRDTGCADERSGFRIGPPYSADCRG